MPHGYPDWFGTLPGQNVFGGVDVLEAAARLGSWFTTLRRGNLFWCDFFTQHPGIWGVQLPSSGFQIYKSTISLVPNIAPFCITGSYDPPQYIFMSTSLPLPIPSNIAGEITFKALNAIGIFDFNMYFYQYNQSWYALVRFVPGMRQIQITTTGGQTITYDVPFSLRMHDLRFVTIRVGVDTVKNEYRYVAFNNRIILTTGVKLRPAPGYDLEQLTLQFIMLPTYPELTIIPYVAAVFLNDF